MFNAGDNKKTRKQREDLAEYYHKIILNNIITGVSFEKRAWNKRVQFFQKEKEIEKRELMYGSHESHPNNVVDLDVTDTESQQYYFREIRLYICEAVYYFKVANQQMREQGIFEYGERDEYIDFIKIIGLGTLKSVYDIYVKSYYNLSDLNNFALMSDQNKPDLDDIKDFLNDFDLRLREFNVSPWQTFPSKDDLRKYNIHDTNDDTCLNEEEPSNVWKYQKKIIQTMRRLLNR